MSAAAFFSAASLLAMIMLAAGMLLSLLRIARGPTLPDRILALDLLTTLGIGFIAAFAARSGIALYVDISIALCLVGFISTLALTRYLMANQRGETTANDREEDAR